MYSYLEILIAKILESILGGWNLIILFLIGLSCIFIHPKIQWKQYMLNIFYIILLLILTIHALKKEYDNENK